MASMAAATELERIVGAKSVISPVPASSPYNRDMARRRGAEGRADAVALPADAGQVAAVVAWCYAHDVPIVPRGGGTGVAGGAAPIEGGVVLSLERLRRVRELDPALWRMLPEAGVRTRDVQRLARENGLVFAPDPGAAEDSQIGGNVATNAGGPHALKYGPTGAWVLGVEAVLAPGELVEIGSWAASDVGGYDIRSLLVGSEGTLGVITAVRLRLLPAPEVSLPLFALFADRDSGCAAVAAVLGAGIRPSVLDFLDADTLRVLRAAYPLDGEWLAGGPEALAGAGFALLLEVDGSSAAAREELASMLAALREVSPAAIHGPGDSRALFRWREGINPAVTGVRGAKVSEDVVWPREALCEGLERFERIASRHGLPSCAWGHAGIGNVHATLMVDPSNEEELDAADAVVEELFALTAELGGSISGEHGVGWLKRGRLAGQWPPAAVALHERIKRAFDPKDLLNPGKKLALYPARSPHTAVSPPRKDQT
jgi:glycolate oxidase subunit GlcD